MKKSYKSAEIDIIVFSETDAIVASSVEVITPFYQKGSDDTEIL